MAGRVGRVVRDDHLGGQGGRAGDVAMVLENQSYRHCMVLQGARPAALKQKGGTRQGAGRGQVRAHLPRGIGRRHGRPQPSPLDAVG